MGRCWFGSYYHTLPKGHRPDQPTGVDAYTACIHPDIRRMVYLRAGSSWGLDEGDVRI